MKRFLPSLRRLFGLGPKLRNVADLPNGTYDNEADGTRYSVFCGRVTVWHPSHFRAMPFGAFPVVSVEAAPMVTKEPAHG
jgi:hypothetical protein